MDGCDSSPDPYELRTTIYYYCSNRTHDFPPCSSNRTYKHNFPYKLCINIRCFIGYLYPICLLFHFVSCLLAGSYYTMTLYTMIRLPNKKIWISGNLHDLFTRTSYICPGPHPWILISYYTLRIQCDENHFNVFHEYFLFFRELSSPNIRTHFCFLHIHYASHHCIMLLILERSLPIIDCFLLRTQFMPYNCPTIDFLLLCARWPFIYFHRNNSSTIYYTFFYFFNILVFQNNKFRSLSAIWVSIKSNLWLGSTNICW